MSVPPEKPRSTVHRAVRSLRQMIFAGDLPPASDHLEAELAARLGMSRTPVREAVLMLASLGLLELRPRKGVRITSVSDADIREVFDILAALEGLAAARAATVGYQASDLQALARSINDMNAALLQPDLVKWADAEDRFHVELVRLGGNTRSVGIVNMMNDQVRRVRAATLSLRPLPTKSNADHRLVYQAIRDGNATAARAHQRTHREETCESLITLLEQHRRLVL